MNGCDAGGNDASSGDDDPTQAARGTNVGGTPVAGAGVGGRVGSKAASDSEETESTTSKHIVFMWVGMVLSGVVLYGVCR